MFIHFSHTILSLHFFLYFALHASPSPLSLNSFSYPLFTFFSLLLPLFSLIPFLFSTFLLISILLTSPSPSYILFFSQHSSLFTPLCPLPFTHPSSGALQLRTDTTSGHKSFSESTVELSTDGLRSSYHRPLISSTPHASPSRASLHGGLPDEISPPVQLSESWSGRSPGVTSPGSFSRRMGPSVVSRGTDLPRSVLIATTDT